MNRREFLRNIAVGAAAVVAAPLALALPKPQMMFRCTLIWQNYLPPEKIVYWLGTDDDGLCLLEVKDERRKE